MDRYCGKVWASVVGEAADSDSRSQPAPLPKTGPLKKECIQVQLLCSAKVFHALEHTLAVNYKGLLLHSPPTNHLGQAAEVSQRLHSQEVGFAGD